MGKKNTDDSNMDDQSKRFIEAARELGCDEDEAAFKERLKKLAKAPPPATVSTRKAKKQK